MKPADFIHPEDAAALRQLENIPGLPTLLKQVMKIGAERLMYGLNMAQRIHLSENQLPELYRHLPPICEKLGIPEPDFYLEMSPEPNAYAFGDTRLAITVTSSLVEMLNEEELDAVIAHECGHIICRHMLYHNLANIIFNMSDALGVFGILSKPIEFALAYWYRKSELSCDRVSAIVTSPEVTARTMARLAGGPKAITENINLSEWAKQADTYDELCKSNLWDKTLQRIAVMQLDHPFSAVRAREVLKWAETDQFQTVKHNFDHQDADKCPSCGKRVDPTWMYCQFCGTKIK